MKITSPAFLNNSPIPEEFTCKGPNASPPLQIEGVPAGALELALVVEDPDAPGRIWQHWLVWNIDPTTTEIIAGAKPTGAVEGITDFGSPGYGGPCPPSGTHRYHFKLFALDAPLLLAASAGRAELNQAMAGHILAEADLVGLFGHNQKA